MDTVVERANEYRVGRPQSILILIVLTLLYTMSFADRSILSVVLEPMKVSLGLTDTELGVIQSIFSVGIAVLTIPASILVERWSRRWMIGFMAIIWSLATLATGLSTRFIHLIIARFCVGIGEAGYNPGSTGWLSLIFSKERRGRVLSIFGIGASLGTIIGLIVGGIIVTRTGDWRSPFYIFAVPGIILGAITFFFKDYATVKDKGEYALNKTYLREWIGVLKIKSVLFNTLGMTCWGLFYFTFIGWLPALIMRVYSLDSAKSGAIVGIAALLSIVGMPFGGWIADIWQRRNKAGRAYMMALLQLFNMILTGALLFALYGPLNIFIIVLTTQMIIVMMIPPMSTSINTDIIPVKHRISGHSLVILIGYLVGAALGPWLVGLISDSLGGGAEGLKSGFLYIYPVLLLAIIFHFINARKYYAEDCARCSDQVFEEEKK
jgi:MFS family permease